MARRVSMDLSREIFDTRLAPDGEAALRYERPKHPSAAFVVFRVLVEPDAFYAAFYRDTLKRNTTRAGRKRLEQALAAANASAYTLFEQREPLPGSPNRQRLR